MSDSGNTGELIVLALKQAGTSHLFTLNGAHIWPMLTGSVEHGIRIVDTRHEQTATFAAEGWSKITRECGVATVTAGPGVTNALSAITAAHSNDSPLLVVGGRALAGLRDPGVPCEPPPPFPQRRVASAAGLRPHMTIKIDHTLRASAHRAAADEGSSLTQVVEAILDRYLGHGMADEDQAPPEGYSRRRTRIIRHASAASTGTSPSKSP